MNNKTDIEEDIKILKDLKDKKIHINTSFFTTGTVQLDEKEKQAIENILADRERLQEKNDIYKEENQKITKALDFKEGTLNPDASIIIKSMKQALIQLKAKANKYDSLVEKIKESLNKRKKEYEEILSDYGNIDTDITFNIPNKNVRKHLDNLVIEIMLLQELLDTEK